MININDIISVFLRLCEEDKGHTNVKVESIFIIIIFSHRLFKVYNITISFDLVRRPVGPKAQVENAEKVIKKLPHVLELSLKNYLIF